MKTRIRLIELIVSVAAILLFFQSYKPSLVLSVREVDLMVGGGLIFLLAIFVFSAYCYDKIRNWKKK